MSDETLFSKLLQEYKTIVPRDEFKKVEKPRKKKQRKMMKGSRYSWMTLILISSLFQAVSSVTTTTNNNNNNTNNTHKTHSSVSALFVLGDSSVSCGDNTFFNTFYSTAANYSLYPCIASQTHLLPDLLAEKLALPSIPPFYSQNGTIEGLVTGLNFGSSQATIMSTGSISFQALNQQLRQVYETLQVLQLQLGIEKAQDLIQSSLFYISLGKDDYIQLFRCNSCKRCKYKSGGFARILVKQMIRVVKDLYNANAKKIIFMGIVPLGCTPRALWESYNSTGRTKVGGYCVDEMNEHVLEYNSMLSEQLVDLNYELFDAQIVFCDIYQGIMEIITDPKRFGFSNVKRACCGLGRYGGMVGCLSKEMACNDTRAHVWWDFYNPTEGVNSLLANSIWSGQPFDICHPINIEKVV